MFSKAYGECINTPTFPCTKTEWLFLSSYVLGERRDWENLTFPNMSDFSDPGGKMNAFLQTFQS